MEVFHSVWNDLRTALRVLSKSPGETALCIVSIALGIGLTAGMFSAADATLLRPLPVHDPRRLFQLVSFDPDGSVTSYRLEDYNEMTSVAAGLGELAAYQRRSVMMVTGDENESVPAQPATENYFSVAGVKPLFGIATVASIDGHPQAVLSYRLWQRRFGGYMNVVGKTVLLNKKPFLIAGVMPREFTGLLRGRTNDVWTSHEAWSTVFSDDYDQFEIVARLNPGITPQRAMAQLDAAIRGPGKRRPARAGSPGTILAARFAPNWTANVIFGGGFLLSLSLVLFVACANVAQFRLARTETRRNEMGVRLALGAGTKRIAQQLLLETSLIALPGAACGVLLARMLMDKTSQFLASINASLDFGIRLDYRALAYVIFAVVLAVLFSGLAPARHAVRLGVAEMLKCPMGATGFRRIWGSDVMLMGQVAVSIALFGLGSLYLVSLRNALAIRPGFDPQKKILVMTVAPGWRIGTGRWCEQICARLANVAGVRDSTFARRFPLSGVGGGLTARVGILGRQPFTVPLNNVGDKYFGLMDTRILAGRGIGGVDQPGSAPVVVISQEFARQAFPVSNPIGQWLKIDSEARQIVGVAENGPANYLREPPQPYLWLPFNQAPSNDITLIVETLDDPQKMANVLRREVKDYDPGVEILSSETLRHKMDGSLSPDRIMADISGGLAMFSVLLTAAGLFGVQQYAVNRRTHEFGLRLALGASPIAIQRMVLTDSVRIAAWGIPMGLLLLFAAARSTGSWLLGISPLNPFIYAFSAAAALALALIAAWLPAVRAIHIDPAEALRAE